MKRKETKKRNKKETERKKRNSWAKTTNATYASGRSMQSSACNMQSFVSWLLWKTTRRPQKAGAKSRRQEDSRTPILKA